MIIYFFWFRIPFLHIPQMFSKFHVGPVTVDTTQLKDLRSAFWKDVARTTILLVVIYLLTKSFNVYRVPTLMLGKVHLATVVAIFMYHGVYDATMG